MTSRKVGDMPHVEMLVVDADTARYGGDAFRRVRKCRAVDLGAVSEGVLPLLECSACGGLNYAQADGGPWRYCPNCGAEVER